MTKNWFSQRQLYKNTHTHTKLLIEALTKAISEGKMRKKVFISFLQASKTTGERQPKMTFNIDQSLENRSD